MLRSIERKKKVRKVAVAYARYSSSNQREESIDAQLRAIREYCEKESIELIATFTDEAMSGKTDGREDFQNMINQLLKGHLQVDFVLVHKFNRFARNKFDSALYKKKLRDVDIKVVSVTQKIDDTPEGELLEGFLETIDQYYSANLAVEVRKGLRENALKGKHAGGQVPLGYSLDDDGYYVPNENAKIIKRMFEEYASGIPKTEICERLNAEGYRNQRGKKFNVRTLYDILRNEKYIGNYVYTIDKKETIRLDGIIKNPPINKTLWNAVQKLCKESSEVHARVRSPKRYYYLTGKTFCTCCGEHICGAGSKRSGGGKDKEGKLNYYYKCVGRTSHKNGCKNPSLNKDWFEPKVLKAVTDIVMNEKYVKEIAKIAYDEILSMREEPAISTAQLKKELAQILKKQNRLTDLYLEEDISKEMLDEKNGELSRRRYQIEEELEKRKNVFESEDIRPDDIENFITQFVEDLKEDCGSIDDEFMRIMTNTFVKRIDVSMEEVTVHIHTPFGRMDSGDSVCFRGVICRLTPVKLTSVFPRKKHIHGRIFD